MSMDNTKSLFRCARERMGLPQFKIAEMIGVRESTCRHWETSATPHRKPSEKGIAAILLLEKEFNNEIETLISEYRNNYSIEEQITLSYYPSQEKFEECNPGTRDWFGYKNAVIREVKAQLERDGYTVSVEYKI